MKSVAERFSTRRLGVVRSLCFKAIVKHTVPLPMIPRRKMPEKRRRKHHFIVGVVRSLHASDVDEFEVFASMLHLTVYQARLAGVSLPESLDSEDKIVK